MRIASHRETDSSQLGCTARTSESSTVRCNFGGALNSEGLSTFAAVETLRGAEGEPCNRASASLAACIAHQAQSSHKFAQ